MKPISHAAKENLTEEYLRVSVSKRKISLRVRIIKYRDKDTRQIVIFAPSLDISSYGATEKKAFEMFRFSANEFCKFLINLSSKKIEFELKKLGWKHHPIKNKEYSIAYVDTAGKLKNFNAVAGEVEEELITL